VEIEIATDSQPTRLLAEAIDDSDGKDEIEVGNDG
jgi:hypothetical protein